MARVYKVSADTSEKEKVIGGILTLAQGIWLGLGLIMIAALFLLFSRFLPWILALILAAPPGGAFGLIFAFKTKEGLPFMTYLLLKKKYDKKEKYLINTLTYGKEFD